MRDTDRGLTPLPLTEALACLPGTLTLTMRPDQWDALIQAAYDTGCTLLVLDEDEQPIRAWRRPTPEVAHA